MRRLAAVFLIAASALFFGCADSDTSSYTVTYDGNGHDGGTVPADGAAYEEGDTVTVADAGTMSLTDHSFAVWNTTSDGNGTDREAGSTFAMGTADVTLYAQWGGKLTVTISNAVNFTGHSIYYSIYDSDETDATTHAPSGNILGQARLEIIDNEGSVVTATSTTDPTEKVFKNGTYYLGGMVDMNDNAVSTNYSPDSGDKYGDFVTVTITGDTTVPLTESDFSLTMP